MMKIWSKYIYPYLLVFFLALLVYFPVSFLFEELGYNREGAINTLLSIFIIIILFLVVRWYWLIRDDPEKAERLLQAYPSLPSLKRFKIIWRCIVFIFKCVIALILLAIGISLIVFWFDNLGFICGVFGILSLLLSLAILFFLFKILPDISEIPDDSQSIFGLFALYTFGVIQILSYVLSFYKWYSEDHFAFWPGFKELLWALCPVANIFYVWDTLSKILAYIIKFIFDALIYIVTFIPTYWNSSTSCF